MCLRVYTSDVEAARIKEELLENVRMDGYLSKAFQVWRLDSEGRLTLTKPRFADKAYFRIVVHPGCGMVVFDLEEGEGKEIERDVWRKYHESMMDMIWRYFSGRFYLLEKSC